MTKIVNKTIKVLRCKKCGCRTMHTLINPETKTYKCSNCGTCQAG